jgi:osmoprotectant transport system permease protein
MTFLDALAWIGANGALFWGTVEDHLVMCAVALAIGLVIGLPLAILVTGRRWAASLAINLVNAIRTIPSIAILAAALPLLGIGFVPSVVALVVLALPPILLNAYVGLRDVDPDVIDAARGMGMREREILTRVRLPLAAPAMFAGTRTAAVQVLSGATLASFIGGGGLGDFVTSGIAMMDVSRLLVGAVPIAALALTTEFGLAWAERRLFAERLETA